MILVMLITLLIAIINGGIWLWGWRLNNKTYGLDGFARMCVGGFLAVSLMVIAILEFLGCFRWQIGTDVRTGYIYSVDEYFGKGKIHIRLGENAGEDSQTPICVSGENLNKAKELAGSGKRVKITIPATGIHFENDYFACTSEPNIEIEENK